MNKRMRSMDYFSLGSHNFSHASTHEEVVPYLEIYTAKPVRKVVRQ